MTVPSLPLTFLSTRVVASMYYPKFRSLMTSIHLVCHFSCIFWHNVHADSAKVDCNVCFRQFLFVLSWELPQRCFIAACEYIFSKA